MASPIIKVESLSKKFIIAHEESERYSTLRDVITNGAKKIFKKRSTNHTKEEFWALKDVNFEINQGDRVGIIGRNGAGKSTLLKVLSRITDPSEGRISIRGRVASLLEVGTGFHPELTGRENIFLNGAILGMSRAEIRKKFDEIVAFAEVEKFLDTPVKRYSSGMYVRLAFAVAAHLEPEILIIDEVLAVGDAQFQKKCLGKMEDVSKNEGRTVLFVSHNMGVVTQLCKSAILLNKGSVAYTGNAIGAIDKYLSLNLNSDKYVSVNNDKEFFFESAELLDEENNFTNSFGASSKIILRIKVRKNIPNAFVKFSCTIQSKTGDYLTTFVENMEEWFDADTNTKTFQVTYPADLLSPNLYAFRLALFLTSGHVFDLVEMICPFSIIDEGSSMAAFEGISYGYFLTNHEFTSL
jgi:lipopolysaccharide transport system ATP-binding protein